MILRISLLAAILALLTVSPAATNNHLEPSSAFDNIASTSSFYSFRRDMRRCAAPRCGGYFVKLVNESRTRCADNRFQRECYVAEIDWRGQSEPDSDRALLRGTIRLEGHRHGAYGVFRVTEVWQAASANQPTGTFYRVRDRGLRCVAAPCPTHHEATLNSTASRNVAGVDLSGANAPNNLLSEAMTAMTSRDGILVSGTHSPVTGPAGRSQMLNASQFYLRATGSGAKAV